MEGLQTKVYRYSTGQLRQSMNLDEQKIVASFKGKKTKNTNRKKHDDTKTEREGEAGLGRT